MVATSQTIRRGVLAIDLGKTSCRARIGWTGGLAEAHGPGSPGLANHDGLAAARASVVRVAEDLPAGALAEIECAGIGAAGADADRESARELAEWLSGALADARGRALGGSAGAQADVHAEGQTDVSAGSQTHAPTEPPSRVPVVVVSDALAAHAGALEGGPGTVLIAGTGAVAFRLGDDGVLRRADGWGPWLGDQGSGRWIGQEGLACALRGYDGRGPATSLTPAAVQLAGSPDALPAYVMSGGAAERVLGSFAPVVLEHARAGDEVAAEITAQAVSLLTRTALAASGGAGKLAMLGGLTGDRVFAEQLGDALQAAGLDVVPAAADALSGAAILALRSDLPHERYAIRD